MKDLILIKLTNNQEIVAGLVRAGTDEITIKQPRFISYVPDGQGNFQTSLIPYSPIHPDGEYTLNTTTVLSVCIKGLPTVLEDMFASHTTGLEISSGLSK